MGKDRKKSRGKSFSFFKICEQGENTLFMLSQIAFSVQMSANQVNQGTANLTSGT